jgi:hypothetical protein
VISQGTSDRAYGYKETGSGPERIPAFPFVSPPKQQGCSGVKPEASSDEFALTQIDDRPQPRPYCEAKCEPEEQYYGYENRSYEAHFSSTGSIQLGPSAALRV